MASRLEFVQYLSDQVRGLSYRQMFGEYAIYYQSKVVALVCDNQLFIKPTASGRSFIGQVEEAPPYPGAKNYFLIEDIDDSLWLNQLIMVTAQALPPKKKK